MRKWTAALLICCLAAGMGLPAFAAPGEEVPVELPEAAYSQMALLYEETTGTLIYEKKIGVRNPAASMTKVMTALLVLEYDPELSGETVVPPEAVSKEYCYWMDTYHLEAGEEITVRDLMYYLLIASGNEAATTLAAYVAGDIPSFVDRMNDKARELGMLSSHFADPHGLSEQDLVTCEDMLVLCREAMKNPTFREIVRTTSGILPASNLRSRPIRYTTSNSVLQPNYISEYDGGFSEDILGIKTGWIGDESGYNLACAMEYEGMTFYSVVMHADEVLLLTGHRYGHFMDTVSLMTYARTFHKQGYSAGDPVAETATKGSFSPNLTAVAQEDIWILVQEDAEPEIVWNADIGSRVKAGDVVGRVTLSDRFGNVRETALVAAADASAGMARYLGMAVVAAVIAVVEIIRRKRGRRSV